jgi:hypothetical protein
MPDHVTVLAGTAAGAWSGGRGIWLLIAALVWVALTAALARTVYLATTRRRQPIF